MKINKWIGDCSKELCTSCDISQVVDTLLLNPSLKKKPTTTYIRHELNSFLQKTINKHEKKIEAILKSEM